MSDAARHALFIVAEDDFGVTPANPAFQRVRHNSTTVGVQRGSLQSEELRDDRQIATFRLGAHSVAGDIAAELSFGSFDTLLEAALGGSWTDTGFASKLTISVDADDDSFNDSANGFIAAGLVPGVIFTSAGFTTAGNNGTWKVATATPGKITVTQVSGAAAAALVDEAAGEDVGFTSTEEFLLAGTERRSFSLLRHFGDIEAAGEGKPYHLFNGVEVNTAAFNMTAEGMVTVTFGLMGREGVAPANIPPAGSTFGAATTTDSMDAFSGALTNQDGALAVTSEFSFTLENGMEPRPVIGTKFGLQPSIGRSNLTGTTTSYFEDSSLVGQFVNEEAGSLAIVTSDGVNSYVLEVLKMKFTAGQPDVSGQGSIALSMPFQGLLDPVTGSNIRIRKRPLVAA